MIRLIVYDLDGTLIDSRLDIANAVNATLLELGWREIAVEKVSSFVGGGVKNLMRLALEEAGAEARGLSERAIQRFRKRYGEHLLEHTQLYPAVPRVLEFFKDRLQAVITNKPESFSRAILKGLGIGSYFFRILGGDAGFPKKPAPEALLEILKSAGVPAEEAVLVGDSAIDVETGRTHQLAHSPAELERAVAEHNEGLARFCKRQGIAFVQHRLDEPLETFVLKALPARGFLE